MNINVSFDETGKVRVLDAAKYEQTKQLQEQCANFSSSTSYVSFGRSFCFVFLFCFYFLFFVFCFLNFRSLPFCSLSLQNNKQQLTCCLSFFFGCYIQNWMSLTVRVFLMQKQEKKQVQVKGHVTCRSVSSLLDFPLNCGIVSQSSINC